MTKKTTRKAASQAPARGRESQSVAKRASETPGKHSMTKRDFLAHVWQFLHYVDDVMCDKVYNKIAYKQSTLYKKGQQIRQFIHDIE